MQVTLRAFFTKCLVKRLEKSHSISISYTSSSICNLYFDVSAWLSARIVCW